MIAFLPSSSVPFPAIEKYLLDYQNPRNADALTKIQDDLDETKIILVIEFFYIYLSIIIYL